MVTQVPNLHYGAHERAYHMSGRVAGADMYRRFGGEVQRYSAGTPAYPSDVNVYIPTHEATNGMIVDFSRNPSEFALNRYIKFFPVSDKRGYYARFGRDGGLPEEKARITDTAFANFVWPDDGDAPDGSSFKELFQYVEFTATRYAYPWRVPYTQGQQASWDIKRQYANDVAQLAMTVRTQAAISLFTNPSNYVTGHTSAVASITGNTGKWDVSTTSRQDIRRSIHAACEKIRLDTLGKVRQRDLLLVLSPGLAAKIARSQEIVDYIKQQEGSPKVIKGEAFGGDFYDLPERLYGCEVVIEDAVKVTNHKNAVRNAINVLGDDVAFICARPGGLEGTDARAPNFSTASLMVWDQEEMLVEEQDNTWHKRTDGRIVDTFVATMNASATGYLFTEVVD
jgi:hypothetical protein